MRAVTVFLAAAAAFCAAALIVEAAVTPRDDAPHAAPAALGFVAIAVALNTRHRADRLTTELADVAERLQRVADLGTTEGYRGDETEEYFRNVLGILTTHAAALDALRNEADRIANRVDKFPAAMTCPRPVANDPAAQPRPCGRFGPRAETR